MKSTNAVTVAAISAALLSSPWGIAPAQADDLNGDVIGCPADVPCINELYQEGSTLHIGWDGHEHFDHYNLRWSRPGRDETQYETAGGSHGSFSINNINAGMVYTVKVQGCDTNFFGESTCSGWGEGQFKAKANLPYGPDTCKQGYVWREAFVNDHVCVVPQSRSAAKADNAVAASRRVVG